jgi:DNA invertase Pin-like site-specific DNA recombinase
LPVALHKVIELIRVSTAGQAGDDRASIPAQRTINRRTAQAHGLEIDAIIEMTDVSGAAVMHAPEMHKLIAMLRSKRYHGVVAREFSRLMRPENFYDMGLLQEFVDAKAILYLPEGPIDFSSKTGRLMGTIRAAMAGAERTELLERSWSAKEEMRRSGKCPSGYVTWPFAVAYDDQRGWHYTHDAEKVRKAFKLFTSGITSFTVIARETGLSRTALATILRNAIYMGWRVYDKRRDQAPEAKLLGIDGRQGDRRKMQRSEEETIRVRVIPEEAALIDENTFHAAQAIITAKHHRHWKCRHDAEQRFVYSGFLVCADCQKNIYTQSGRSVKNRSTGELANYDYYVCSQRRANTGQCKSAYMDRVRLESKLDDVFAERLTDRGYVAEIIEEFMRRNGSNKNSRAAIARLQQTINSLRDKRERVIESVIDGMITRDDGKARTTAIDRDIASAQEALMRETPGTREITPGHLAVILAPLLQWKFLERDHKRRFLAASVPEIHVADLKIHGIGILQSPNPEQSNLYFQERRGVQRAGPDLGIYGSHRRTVCLWMRRSGTARSPVSR